MERTWYWNDHLCQISRPVPHLQSGDSQAQKMFLAPSADKQTPNYGTECSNHRPFLSALRSKGLSCSKMKWWAIYTNLPANAIVRISHPRSRDSQGHETFLAPSVLKQTHKCDTECSNHHPSLSTLRSQGLSHSKMKWWTIYTNLYIYIYIYTYYLYLYLYFMFVYICIYVYIYIYIFLYLLFLYSFSLFFFFVSLLMFLLDVTL